MYGTHRVIHVPLCYHEFNQIKVLGELYTSFKSRSERSTAIIAAWPCVTGGVLASRQPTMEDLHIGELQYFFMHTPILKKRHYTMYCRGYKVHYSITPSYFLLVSRSPQKVAYEYTAVGYCVGVIYQCKFYSCC